MKWSTKCLTLFGIFCYTAILGQSSSRIDSLIATLDTISVDTQQVDRLIDIAALYRYKQFDKANEYAQLAYHFADSIQFESGKSRSLFQLAVIYRKQGGEDQLEKAIKIHRTLIEEAREKDNYRFAGINGNSLGNTLESVGEYRDAVKAFHTAKDDFDEAGYRYGKAMVLNNIGIAFKSRKNYETASDYFQKAILAYQDVEDHKKEDAKTGLAWAYMNLGNVTEVDSLAIPHFEQSLKLHQENENDYGILSVNICLGAKYIDQERYEIALPHYTYALSIAEKVNSTGRIATAKSSIGKIYLKKGDLNKAYNFTREALQICVVSGYKEEEEETRRNLAMIYSEMGQYKASNKEFQKVIHLRDSLYSDEDSKIINELEAEYEVKEKEAALAAKELEIAKEKGLRARQLLIAAGIIIIALLVFFAYANRMRKKREEDQLALALEEQKTLQLKELDDIKSNFFANIAHEFRTPLTLILSPLREMAQGVFKGNQHFYFGLMKRNAERLLNLVNQLLDLSKLESGKMQLNLEKQELGKFIKNLAHSFQSLADRKEIQYRIFLPNSKDGQDLWGQFDGDKLEKVITNLLSNAFKFTPEEGMVSLKVSAQDQDLHLEVIDNGLGIPKEKIGNIFDRFYQVTDTEYRTDEGSGIGLALTKELVELHGGTITVESEEKAFTSFKVVLPILVQATDLSPSETLSPKITASTPAKEEKTNGLADASIVLVVEDNEDLREYIQERLQPSFKVETAENGRVGMDKAKAMIPDLIISDVMMPEMNGIEMCEALKQDIQTNHIPIIMLTAKGEMEDKLAGLEKGADDYLSKPFDARELEIRIKNLVEQRTRLREKFSQTILNTQSSVSSSEKAISPGERFLQRMITVIEANMEDEQFNVERMASAMHLSRYQLHRKMKALTGKSISVFIRTIRLKHAHRLLEMKKGNVSEIAFQLGFNSVAYFSKCFTEEFGYSPSKV